MLSRPAAPWIVVSARYSRLPAKFVRSVRGLTLRANYDGFDIGLEGKACAAFGLRSGFVEPVAMLVLAGRLFIEFLPQFG